MDEDLIERRVVGQSQIRRWIQRSRMDLDLAAHAATNGDPERAMTLVYEAAFAPASRSSQKLVIGYGAARVIIERLLKPPSQLSARHPR